MIRTAPLVWGCSIVLVVAWLLVGIHDANVAGYPNEIEPKVPREGGWGHFGNLQRNEILKERELKNHGVLKKKLTMRGVSVDRSNIVDPITMQDLEAPLGRLWIPAAITGPIEPNKVDPLANVLVAYCQLDMAAYHKSPWMFAMGTFHQRQSGCLDDKSLVRTFRFSSLKFSSICCLRKSAACYLLGFDIQRLVDENPNAFMDPSGFIYHETRCGSTLTANMIAAIPSNIVHSETPPPVAVLNLCSGEGKCSDDLRDQLVRTMFRLMGPVQDGHTHLFFKFQSSKYVPAVEKAWPETKWIYLFRDPLEVIASNLKGAWRKIGANAARNTTQLANNQPVYNLGGPCVRGVRGSPKVPGGKPTPPPPQVLVNACVKQLESLNQVALEQIQDGSPNGLVVEYRQLPEVISEFVYPVHFGMATTDAEREESKQWMEPVTHVYSKGMATPQEEAVSKDFEQGMDLQVKEEGSDIAMRDAAASMCENYRKLVGLQRWRKEDEGGTMGTCR